ncbi:MAG: hypothetical protein WBO28_02555, partial [Flavobacteriales bacterium]
DGTEGGGRDQGAEVGFHRFRYWYGPHSSSNVPQLRKPRSSKVLEAMPQYPKVRISNGQEGDFGQDFQE